MNVKVQLLRLLASSPEEYISGGALAKKLSVSRSAVWKAVESLRKEGYSISASTNKGYRLESSGDALSAAAIATFLKNENAFHIDVRKSVSSTNTLLRELSAKSLPEGYVLAAEEQSSGKGRIGRSFYSPSGCGIYFSLLLRPDPKSADATLITSAAAVATALAIEDVTGIQVGIKWVNDLFVGEKKVCGILTEATFDMESGAIESAVLGIGVNVTKPKQGYPNDIGDVVAALFDESPDIMGVRCRLIAAILDNFWKYYQKLEPQEFLHEYRSRSIILGRDIYVLSQDSILPARALAIDDECRLVVQYRSGETATLNSGEVSIRRSQ